MSAACPAPRSGLAARLATRLGRETVVVGIGNPLRGDDAAGCLVAGALRELLAGEPQEPSRDPRPGPPHHRLRVVEAEEVPESFLGPIACPTPDTVVLVDAIHLGEPPGTVAMLEVDEIGDHEASTHRVPLSILAHFLRAESGADVFVLGIQPGRREVGAAPCDEVLESAGILAQVLEEAAILAGLPEGSFSALRTESPEVPC